jgi:N-sulfoglucosamine sulfohydrolase
LNRPNILLALADDASHFGVYGHRFVNTPNIDRIAREGIKFNNAFTCNPKCAPSRACILTGMHTWQLEGACNHYGIFQAKFPVYTDILEKNGYHVGYTGKGWAPGDYKKGGFLRNPAGDEYNRYSLVPPEGTMINRCDYSRNFTDFLERKPADVPFCFWYGCYEPHRHYSAGEGIRAGKRTEDINYIPSYLPDNETVRSDFLDYANEIDWFDLQLGKMIDTLKQRGEYDNTLIIVTSDNGCPFPRIKGQMYEQDFHLPMVACWRAVSGGGRQADDIINFIDLAPTFLEAAGIEQDGMTGKSFLDIFYARGSGIINSARNTAYFGREKHDLGRKGDVGYPVRCVRNFRYLYVRNYEPDRWPAGDPETWFTNCDGGPTKKEVLRLYAEGDVEYFQRCFGRHPAEELYDIAADPDCLDNLAYNGSFGDILEEMRKTLNDELLRTNDPRIAGNGDIFESYESVYPDSSSYKAYEEGRFELQKW